MGDEAGTAITTGDYNVAVGYNSLIAHTTGASNTAIGAQALMTNTTAADNVAVGISALKLNTTGASNVALGANALDANTTASNNTAVGQAALGANTTGSENTAVGKDALKSNTTASHNTALGEDAGAAITTGASNVAIGRAAGDALTTGSQNVIVGGACDASAVGAVNQIVMGYGVTGNANSSFCFGDGAVDSAIAFGATSITAPSDIRLKEDIQDAEVGLDFIKELRPVTFQWKKGKDVPEDMKAHVPDSEERIINGKYNHGFIAQEVKEVLPNLIDGEEYDDSKPLEERNKLSVRTHGIVSYLTKALQESIAKIEALETRVTTLEG